MKKKMLFLLVSVLCLGLLFACGGDDKTDGDVDTVDGDTTDGDTEVIDGDDAVDGDDEVVDGDSEFVFEQCTAEADHFCFAIDSTELMGNYNYILRSELSSSGCSLADGTYNIEFYESTEGWSKILLKIESYNGPAKYSLPDDSISVTLTITGEETKTYRSMNPCSVTAINEIKGSLDCTLYDNDDASSYFKMLGSWLCSE